MNEPAGKRNITAQKAMKMLKEKGIDIDEKNAEKVLDFLYFLAKLTVNQCINHDSSIEKQQHEKGRFIRKGKHR